MFTTFITRHGVVHGNNIGELVLRLANAFNERLECQRMSDYHPDPHFRFLACP